MSSTRNSPQETIGNDESLAEIEKDLSEVDLN